MQNTGQGNLLRVFLVLLVKRFNVNIIFKIILPKSLTNRKNAARLLFSFCIINLNNCDYG